MNKKMIFLANLSGLGSEVRDILGSFMLAIMHLVALASSGMPQDKRYPFHIYLDEAHRFITDSLEDVISETRKYSVSLTLAHQYFQQFSKLKTTSALKSVGTRIVFNLDAHDAFHLTKDFKQNAKVEDFLDLGIGEALVRCENEITKMKTLKPIVQPSKTYREQIIAHSRQHYYRPAAQVREVIEKRMDRLAEPFSPLRICDRVTAPTWPGNCPCMSCRNSPGTVMFAPPGSFTSRFPRN